MMPKSSAMKRGLCLRAGRHRPRCCRRAHRRGRSCRGRPACRTRARPSRRAPCGRCRRRRARRCRRSGMPRTRSIVSARCGGVAPDRLPARTGRCESSQKRRSTEALAPSRCRSSSAASVFSISLTISRGRILSALGCVRSTSAAIVLQQRDVAGDLLLDVRAQHLHHDFARRRRRRALPHAPARSRPRPAARSRSFRRPRRCCGRANARRSRARLARRTARRDPAAATVRSATSGGTRSRRVDRIWPNLTKIGPSSCSARRRRAPRDCAAISCDARGTNGRISFSQRSAGVSSSRSSRR